MAIRLKPIGFWSYARQDDEASRGRLSSLRSLLASELQQQYGRDPIKIFQDVAAIPPGAQWEDEIRKALNTATYFVPIITPAFIESEWCMKEVRIFLERERQIWRDHPEVAGKRRIFPIYYRAIDDVEPIAPDMLAELRRIQWVNFIDLRYEDDQSKPVRVTLDKLASGMCRLLQVRVTAPPTPEELAERERARLLAEVEAVTQRAKEEARKVEEARARQQRIDDGAQKRRDAEEERARAREAEEAERKAFVAVRGAAGASHEQSEKGGAAKIVLAAPPVGALQWLLLGFILFVIVATGLAITSRSGTTSETYIDNVAMEMADNAASDTMDDASSEATGNAAAPVTVDPNAAAMARAVAKADEAYTLALAAAKKGREAAARGEAAAAAASVGQAGYGRLTGTGTDGKGKAITYTYLGQISGNLADGYGVRTWSNGVVSAGSFSEDVTNGFGRMSFKDGDIYEGHLLNGVRSGYGVGFLDGVSIFSQMEKDNANGYGRFVWKSDNEIYKGSIRNDDRDGPGTNFSADGTILRTGIWRKDELVTPLKTP